MYLSRYTPEMWQSNFPNFSVEEVKKHGNLQLIHDETLRAWQRVRDIIGVPLHILAIIKKSTWHKNGRAIDVTLGGELGNAHVNDFVETMLDCGFHGIGVYWNGIAWSFHGDVRGKHQLWTGLKDVQKPSDGQKWTYGKFGCTNFPKVEIP